MNQDDFRRRLLRIDGKGYKAYQDLKGEYDWGNYRLFIDHVQGDPFASPSKLRVRVEQRLAGFPKELYNNRARMVATCDYLARCFARSVERKVDGHRGTGKSGLIAIDAGRQEILERSAVVINSEFVEARFVCGLPARGRTITAREAEQIFFKEIPSIVAESLFYQGINQRELRQYAELAEDQEYLRGALEEHALVAFVADGAILPRRSGVSDLPLQGRSVVPFREPAGLEVSFNLPNRGVVTGMGIPKGVTLIVGGGYHGKSTLLRAIERGVYNHIPGDGRELVITVPDAVKIRAEDGRRVERVDISPFINNLPFGQDTVRFCTDNASGSTSQAVNIMEALEIGSSLLLIDEDTSATNFMIRDARMQALVSKDREPITPFLDKVRQLWNELGVSTILVVGGSGDYLDVADTVIMMDQYRPYNVTERAREISKQFVLRRVPEGGNSFGTIRSRVPLRDSFDPQRGRRVKVGARGLETVQFGCYQIELDDVEQLVDVSQTRAIADIILYAWKKYCDGRRSLREIIRAVEEDIEREGLDVISPLGKCGDYARPRPFEIAAAINRLRSLQIR